MIAGPHQDFEADGSDHAVIFVDDAGYPVDQAIVNPPSACLIETGENVSEVPPDVVNQRDIEFAVTGLCDEAGNRSDLQQMPDQCAFTLASTYALKHNARAKHELHSLHCGHGKQQGSSTARGWMFRCFSGGHGRD
ncbi:hypothetical protein LMG28688_06575 [Paraburkholderia caffeinitolerans]|uniref:Uncharacterized protein n=1 Tax=Paraburkholderia caffeinitolerans TaxID=1723730 RepID=A0A6J5GV49_9BURK|nr:hypothetical protein LMG28688_06575 [Paraburkholderia caffeinitolerans]